jgi:hypothetical protein
MERRYYTVKVVVVLVAIVTAGVTSGIGSTRMAHAVNSARYSAPARIEAAAWHTTACLAQAAAALVGLNATGKL